MSLRHDFCSGRSTASGTAAAVCEPFNADANPCLVGVTPGGIETCGKLYVDCACMRCKHHVLLGMMGMCSGSMMAEIPTLSGEIDRCIDHDNKAFQQHCVEGATSGTHPVDLTASLLRIHAYVDKSPQRVASSTDRGVAGEVVNGEVDAFMTRLIPDADLRAARKIWKIRNSICLSPRAVPKERPHRVL